VSHHSLKPSGAGLEVVFPLLSVSKTFPGLLGSGFSFLNGLFVPPLWREYDGQRPKAQWLLVTPNISQYPAAPSGQSKSRLLNLAGRNNRGHCYTNNPPVTAMNQA
jgi:hypothetical protein